MQGGMTFWNSSASQARLHVLAGSVAGQALALNTSGAYLGVSMGTAMDGVAPSRFGRTALPLIAAGFTLGALILLALARRASPADRRLGKDKDGLNVRRLAVRFELGLADELNSMRHRLQVSRSARRTRRSC